MSKQNYKYRIYNGKIIKEIIKKSEIYLFGFLFICGIVFGAYYVKQSDALFKEKISEICTSYIQSKAGQGITENIISNALINMIFSAINIFLGFSLIGFPLLFWVPLLKGLGVGVFSGYMYSSYKLTGLGYCAMLVYPGTVISAFSLILACCDSCAYSKNAFEKSIRGKGQFEKDETKIYLIRQFIYLAICFCSSVIDALSAILFSKLFNF